MDSILDQSIFDSLNNSAVSDTDDQRIIQELHDKIEDLENENRNLKASLDLQVKFADISAKISEDNNKLYEENRHLSTQNSDLNQRLKICVQENKELKLQLENEREIRSKNENESFFQLREEAERFKQEQKCKINNLTERISELSAQNEKLLIEIKTEKNQIGKILTSSERYHEKKFSSTEELLTFLSNPQNSIPKRVTPVVEPPKAIVVDNSKLNKYKEQISQHKQTIIELKRTIEKQNQEKRAIERETRQTQMNYQEDSERKIINMKSQFESGKAALEAQISSLKATVADLQKELSKPLPPPEQKVVIKTVVDQSAVEDLNDQIEKLKEDAMASATSYEARILSLKEDNSDLIEQLSSKTNELVQIQSQLSKANLELQNDQLIISELKSTNNSLRNVIHNKQPQTQTEQKKKQQKQSDAEYQKLLKSFDNMKSQCHDLQMQESEHLAEREALKRKISGLESELEKTNKLASSTALDLQDCRNQLKKRKEMTPEDILPSSILIPRCFEPEISAKIENIVNNPSLQISSKLQTIYQIISDNIKATNEKNDADTREMISEFEHLKAKINEFLIDATVALFDKAISFDSIKGGELTEIVDKISQLRRDNETYSRQVQVMQSALNELDMDYGSIEAIRESFARIREEKEEREEKLQHYKEENKELKESMNEATEEFNTTVADLQAQLDDAIFDLSNAKRAHDSLKADFEKLSDENKQLKTEFEKVATDFNSLKGDFESEVANKVNQMRELAQSEINDVNAKLDELSEEFAKLTAGSEEKDKTISGLKEKVLLAQNENTQLQEELERAKQNFDSQIKAKETAFAQEKEHLKAAHDKSIACLSEQCESSRQDIERMSIDIAKKESMIAKLNEALSNLRNEARKSDRALRLQVDKLERDIRYIEVEKRHSIMEIQNECNAKIQDQKKESEEKERELFVYTLSKFKQFFNPMEQLNERTYRSVIEAAKEELDRLEKSDSDIRRMLSCSDMQTTKDAVARLIIKY